MDVDFLIIGQGLAGSLLAWALIQRDCKVLIIDNGQDNASQMAAGLINPITGMRFAKSENVDFLLPAAKRKYASLAEFFQKAFFHEKPMLRIFRSQQEFKHCQLRLFEAGYRSYLGGISEQPNLIASLETPFGCVNQKQTGYLLTQPLLNSLKAFFIAKNSYRRQPFVYQALQMTSPLRWRDVSAQRIIFCEGYQANRNPWFSGLPLQPVKGDILTLQHAAGLPDKILNSGSWVIPLNDGLIRVGASFERDPLNNEISLPARAALLTSLNRIAPSIKTVLLSQQSGIRPCTSDRQPLIGIHPHHPQLAIFNGFGAKGSLQIPWCASHFADVLLKRESLSTTCNISRYDAYLTGKNSAHAG